MKERKRLCLAAAANIDIGKTEREEREGEK